MGLNFERSNVFSNVLFVLQISILVNLIYHDYLGLTMTLESTLVNAPMLSCCASDHDLLTKSFLVVLSILLGLYIVDGFFLLPNKIGIVAN